MADNKSNNKRPMNAADVAMNHLPNSLSRVLQKVGFESQKYQEDVSIVGATEDIYSKYMSDPEVINAPGVRAQIEARRKAQNRMEIYEEAAVRRSLSQVETNVSQSFASVNGQVQQNIKSTAYQHAGLVAASRFSPLQVESRLEASSKRMAGYEEKIRELKTVTRYNELDPESVQQMNSLYGKVAQETKIRSRYEAAAKIHRAQGIDPQSTYETIATSASRANDILMKDPTNAPAQKLAESFDKLIKATDRTSGEFEKLQDDTVRLAREFEASGGGGGNRLNRAAGLAMPWFNAGASLFGAAANATMQIGVNQRLGQAQNAAGFADFENLKYKTYKAAASGDIAALMQMSQFGGAEAFGGNLEQNANISLSEKTASSVFSGLGGILAGAAKGAAAGTLIEPGGGTIVGGILGAIAAGSGDIGNTAVSATDIARNVTGGQANIAARNAQLEVARAVQAVGAEQIQGFRDYSVGLGSASIGLGSRGNAFLDRALTDTNMQRMVRSRISPEQFAQMAQLGVSSMGSVFDQNQIFAARGAESRGYGTMQENMQRMAQLASVGANNPQASLAGVMEVALTRGLDSSKALNAVVDHTAQMAAASTGRGLGLDTTAAAATLLTSTMRTDTPNKEAALERAASVQDAFKNITTNTGMNFAGMVATASMARATGLDRVSAQIFQGMDVETIKSLQADPNAQKSMLDAGIDVRGKDAKQVQDILSRGLRVKQMTAEIGGGVGLALSSGNRVDRNKIIDKLNRGEALTPEEQLYQAQTAALSQAKGVGTELSGFVTGISKQINTAAPAGQEALTLSKGDTTRDRLDRQRTAGFEQMATAAAQGAAALGGATQAVKTLTDAFDKLRKAMPDTEKEATTAAGRAASGGKGLQIDVTGFNGAISNLNTVLNSVMTKYNLGTPVRASDNKLKSPAPGP